MEYSIQEVAKAARTTSRTLRHYDSVGLLPPSRIGANGYRYYDDRSLVRLQRIMLMRQLGLGLDVIGDVLRAQDRASGEDANILGHHLELLREQRHRLELQISSVERTIQALGRSGNELEGADLMDANIFEGFDHTQHREEVEQRWGADAYAKGDRWWRGLGAEEQAEWMDRAKQLGGDWIVAAERGIAADSPEALALARRHVEWLRGIPGTPAHESGGDLAGYLLGLGEMYVADERFAANYGGADGATLVRDALRHYVETELS